MLNCVTIAGRICNDLDLKHTSNQTPTCTFRIACDEDYSSGSEKKTDFFTFVAWRKTAEFISKYFRKGDFILLVGRLKNREWEKDGQKHSVTEIVVDKAYFGGGSSGEKKPVDFGDAKPVGVFAEVDDGELPWE